MTPEHKNEAMTVNECSMNAWNAAAALGIDMLLIEHSLSLTPAGRMFQHDCVRNCMAELTRLIDRLTRELVAAGIAASCGATGASPGWRRQACSSEFLAIKERQRANSS
jgi:hypothetical protein